MVDISMIVVSSLLLAFASWFSPVPSPEADRSVAHKGMAVSWEFEGSHLLVTAQSPLQGWLAVGFNESPELTGTHLVMACVEKGSGRIEGQSVLAPGRHPSILSLGGIPAVKLLAAVESDAGTRVEFSIPCTPLTPYHKNLEAGRKMHLLIAYSMADDFAHHSLARTTFPIEL